MEGTYDFQTPKYTLRVLNSEEDVEIILAYPRSQFGLIIEEIPPLDIFYSPENKVVVRQRKKINLYLSSTTPENESMEVV